MRSLNAAIIAAAVTLGLAPSSQAEFADPPVAVVNGKEIPRRLVSLTQALQGTASDASPAAGESVAERLVEIELVRQWLTARGYDERHRALALDRIQERLGLVKLRLETRKQTLDEVLKTTNATEADVRNFVVFSLAWRAYVEETLTEAQLRERFTTQKRRYDGTKLRASQIFLKAANSRTSTTDNEQLEDLRQLREKIAAGVLTFEAAAKDHSQSPSSSSGGDVGWFLYEGQMPVAFTKQVMDLNVGDLSQPFLTPFGAHLVKVTDLKPGDFGANDVRVDLLTDLEAELWGTVLAETKRAAKIEYPGRQP